MATGKNNCIKHTPTDVVNYGNTIKVSCEGPETACFLYEYHHEEYTALGLPPLAMDRSDTDVHCILKPHHV